MPERFENGDIATWLRQFEACGRANGWKNEDCLKKLSAFLKDRAAAYFYTLPNGERDTYEKLVRNLKSSICPAVERETFFSQFERRKLRPGEGPSVFLWHLQGLLEKTDPNMAEATKTALTALAASA